MNNTIVIVPDGYTPEVKDCPICGLAFSDAKDIINYRKHGCCMTCDDKFRYPNKEKWENGWRPDN